MFGLLSLFLKLQNRDEEENQNQKQKLYVQDKTRKDKTRKIEPKSKYAVVMNMY